MPVIGVAVSYKHRPGTVREFREWCAAGRGHAGHNLGPKERYVGVYMIEGDPTYSLELRTETSDPAVLESSICSTPNNSRAARPR